jgi:hypothetical protein
VVRLIVVALLLAVLLVPSVVAAWNMWCDIAWSTGNVSDWIVCGVMAVIMGDADELWNGYLLHG